MNEINDVKLNLISKISVMKNRKIGICCSVLILNPFKLILFGLKNGEIIFYSYPEFDKVYSFQEHFKSINYICELNQNIISTASDDKTIKIIELNFKKINI
jgi:WD40 repeat protein